MGANLPADGVAHPIKIQPDTWSYDMTIQSNLLGKTALVTGASKL
jgi:hypothetical protein